MVMRMDSGLSAYSGLYTSPGTPEHPKNDPDGTLKTWSSERVPLPARRQLSGAALMPFNSGRALPSKWDDAERWITSPVSRNGTSQTSMAHLQRQIKSKSGPIRSTVPYCSASIPAQDGNMSKFIKNSPLNSGVLVPHDGLSLHFGTGTTPKPEAFGANTISGSLASALGISYLSSESSETGSTDGRHVIWREKDGLFLQHKDVATQMSPDGSTRSSSKGRLSFSLPPFAASGHEHPEIRDVQVDKSTTTTSKRGLKKIRTTKKAEDLPSTWDNTGASKKLSKMEREVAKITAWENLQKAKADAALRKLEIKLEKKRSASIDRIAHKLKQAETKAEAKRDLLFGANPATRQGFFGCHYFSSCFHCNCSCNKS